MQASSVSGILENINHFLCTLNQLQTMKFGKKLIEILENPNASKAHIPCLRIIQVVCAQRSREVVDWGVIPALKKLLLDVNSAEMNASVRVEVCKIILAIISFNNDGKNLTDDELAQQITPQEKPKTLGDVLLRSIGSEPQQQQKPKRIHAFSDKILQYLTEDKLFFQILVKILEEENKKASKSQLLQVEILKIFWQTLSMSVSYENLQQFDYFTNENLKLIPAICGVFPSATFPNHDNVSELATKCLELVLEKAQTFDATKKNLILKLIQDAGGFQKTDLLGKKGQKIAKSLMDFMELSMKPEINNNLASQISLLQGLRSFFTKC